jgi:hypothetical protein
VPRFEEWPALPKALRWPTPSPDTRRDLIREQTGGEYQRNQSPSRLREGVGEAAPALSQFRYIVLFETAEMSIQKIPCPPCFEVHFIEVV